MNICTNQYGVTFDLESHDKIIGERAVDEFTNSVLEELKQIAEDWKYYFDKDNLSLVSTVMLTKAEQLKEGR